MLYRYPVHIPVAWPDTPQHVPLTCNSCHNTQTRFFNMIKESYGTQIAVFTGLLPLTMLWPRVSCECGLLGGCRVTCNVLWGLPFHTSDVSWQSRRCPCPESAYKLVCVVPTLALVPGHACHWRADVCRDTQHNAQTRGHSLLTLVLMYCMHVVLFLYWHTGPCVRLCGHAVYTLSCVWISPCLLFTHWTCIVRFYVSKAVCCGILMLSSCTHESLTMFSSHSWFWSCSRAHGANTVIWMNKLRNGLLGDEAV